MVQHKPTSSSAKKSSAPRRQDDLIAQRLAEMDEAYRKQLRILTDMVRASRLHIRKPRRS